MIDAVFSTGPFKGRYAICDRSTSTQSQVIECFTRLLELPKGRCTSEEILDLLEFGCLNSKLKLDVEAIPFLTDLVVRSRINWGLDETEHEKFRKIPFKEFSWQDGIERLLTEYARGEETSVIYSSCETGGIDGGNAENFGILAQFIETLKEWRSLLHQERTALEWSTFFHQWIDTFFSGGDRSYLPEIAALRFAVNKIVRAAVNAGEERKIASAVFISRLKSEYALPGGKQLFLRDKITFCSLVPLRAVPAKVIAILGLNDGEFPGQSRYNSFDLMATIRRNDPNLANDGRFLFLEALMAAQEHLILSYVGSDNGEERVPAIPLATVESVLKAGFKGFEKTKIPLKSLEETGLKQRRLQRAVTTLEKQAADDFSLDMPQALSLKECLAFLSQNCKAFFKLRCGFEYVPYEKAPLAKDDPDALDNLENSILRKALLAMRIDNVPQDTWFSLVQRTRLLPVNDQTIFSGTQLLINSLPEEIVEEYRHQTALLCEFTPTSTPAVRIFASLAVPEDFTAKDQYRRNCVLCSSAAPEKLLNFYLEQLLLTACYDGQKEISGKLF
jgi:exodeoxyribonuclease V gamma subunit